MVGFAQESRVVAQRELVAGDEPSRADGAAETVDVEDVRSGLHHEIIASKPRLALGTSGTEQPQHANTDADYQDVYGRFGSAIPKGPPF